MSIYTTEVDENVIQAIVMPDGVVCVVYDKCAVTGSFNGITIKNPKQAQALREAVNIAVDILMKNDIKGL